MAREREKSRDLRSCHPAVEAARSAGLVADGPVEASLLQRSGKSLVVRIRPRHGLTVVAKRSRSPLAVAEARVYDEVLPFLPEGHIRLLARSIGDETGWLFLEDAGDVALDTHKPLMRRELGGLLGRFATLTSRMPLAGVFPSYTSEYFRTLLADTRHRLSAAAATPLAESSRTVLLAAWHRLGRVESSWPTIARTFTTGPKVLCHGDLRPTNIRLRGPRQDLTLVDWELAGCGPLAVDLGCVAVTQENDSMLVGFCREFGGSQRWLLEQASAGRILRLIHAMHWAGLHLSTTSAARGVCLIDSYGKPIDRALAQLPYGRGRSGGN